MYVYIHTFIFMYTHTYVIGNAWAAFRVTPLRCCGEIQFTSLLWIQFCLENGSLHRGPPFAIKRTILIGWTMAILEEPCLLSEAGVSQRQTLKANWAKNHRGVDSESYPECGPDVHFLKWSHSACLAFLQMLLLDSEHWSCNLEFSWDL